MKSIVPDDREASEILLDVPITGIPRVIHENRGRPGFRVIWLVVVIIFFAACAIIVGSTIGSWLKVNGIDIQVVYP